MSRNRTNLNTKEKNSWARLLPPVPLADGTKVRARDKRFKKGYVEGVITNRYFYWSYGRRDDPRNYSYVIKCRDFYPGSRLTRVIYKRPETIVKVFKDGEV